MRIIKLALPHHGKIKGPGDFILRLVRFLGHILSYCRELGPKDGLRWYCARILDRLALWRPRQIVLKPSKVMYPLTVGMNPVSDEYAFDQIFIRHEYAAVCDRLKDQRVILDLGANVGYASAFFACRYPEARILAVEPDPRNFALCCENLRPYGERIRILQGAVWSSCSTLGLSYELGGGVAAQVVAVDRQEDGEVVAWDIPALLDIAQAETADLVKIDIEGSEAEVFATQAERWLPRVRNICIELHGARCRQIFFDVLSGFHYDLVEVGESILCLNLRARVLQAGQPQNERVRARAKGQR